MDSRDWRVVLQHQIDQETEHYKIEDEDPKYSFIGHRRLRKAWDYLFQAPGDLHVDTAVGNLREYILGEQDPDLSVIKIASILVRINWPEWTQFTFIFITGRRGARRDGRLPFTLQDLAGDDFLGERHAQLFFDVQSTFLPITFEEGTDTTYPPQFRLPFNFESKSLGHGCYGIVTKVRIARGYLKYDDNVGFNDSTELVVGRKCLSYSDNWGREVQNLRVIRKFAQKHANIIYNFGTIAIGQDINIFFPWTDQDLHSLLQSDHIPKDDRPPHRLLAEVGRLADALHFLHERVIVGSSQLRCYHRDLNSACILVKIVSPDDWVGRWMFTDFDLAVCHDNFETTAQRYKLSYPAPEMGRSWRKEMDALGERANIWSLGCILCEVLAFAVGGRDSMEALLRVARALDTKGQEEDSFDDVVQERAKKEETLERSVQLWLEDIADGKPISRWISECVGLIQLMLRIDPRQRPTAQHVSQTLRVISQLSKPGGQLLQETIRIRTSTISESESLHAEAPSAKDRSTTPQVTMDDMIPLRYAPLLYNQIRILRILPNPDPDSPISCALTTASLEDGPNYEALSYSWGETHEPLDRVLIAGQEIGVRPILHNALRRLRDVTAERCMWIGEICITQQDVPKGSNLGALLASVFRHAQHVVIWLGEPSAATNSAYEVLNDWIRRREDNRKNASLAQLDACSTLLKGNYWTRSWRVQEYALAKRTTLQWGQLQIDATHMSELVNSALEVTSGVQNAENMPEFSMHEVKANLKWFRFFETVKKIQEDSANDVTAFAQLLAGAQELKADSPLDKVYALLALAPHSVKSDLLVDYSISAEEMLQNLVVAFSLEQRLEHLCWSLIDRHLSAAHKAVPRWLPQWLDDLELRTSEILRYQSPEQPGLQEAVFESLALLSVEFKPSEPAMFLPVGEQLEVKKRLQDTFDSLGSLLLEASHCTRVISQSMETAPKILHRIDDYISDSGYSTASSTVEEMSLVAEEIAAHLLGHDFLRRLLVTAEELEPHGDVLETFLRPCIRYLGRELDAIASESAEMLAAREVRRHAVFIARAIVSRLRKGESEEQETIREQRTSRIAKMLDDRMPPGGSRLHDAFNDGKSDLATTAEQPSEYGGLMAFSDESFPQPELPATALGRVKDFMKSDSAFTPFLYLVSRVLYPRPFELIEAEVNRAARAESTSNLVLVQFHVVWDFLTFLTREDVLSDGKVNCQLFLNLLVISGTSNACYATNCESYLRWQWPDTSGYLLSALSQGIENATKDSLRSTWAHTDGTTLAFSTVSKEEAALIVEVEATRQVLVEIAQQLAWLTAACTRAQTGKVCLSEVLFFASQGSAIQIRSLPLKEIKQRDKACWMALFKGTAIAHEYPVPERGGESGIELPFHLMTTLAGPLYPLRAVDRFYFKAHSRMLFPAAVVEGEPDRVQWHFVDVSNDSNDLPLRPPFQSMYSKQLKKVHSLDQLMMSRAFLGYCRNVEVDIGTGKTRPYHKNLLYSGLDDENHSPGVGVPASVTVSTGGLPLNVSATIPITRTKALVQEENKKRDYIDVLNEARYRPVILYEPYQSSGRGWMVPLSCVILHMIHTWLADEKWFVAGMPCINPVSDAGKSARDELRDKWNVVLRTGVEPGPTNDKLVKDLVMQFWDDIREKRFDDLRTITQAEHNLEFQTEKIYGWEYMDIVHGRQTRRKQANVKTNWGLFRDDCMVIFGKNLGDVIRPASSTQLCSKWQSVKERRTYLTATMHCLTTLGYERGGSRDSLTSFRLTNKGYWHYEPRNLFLDCAHSSKEKCHKRPQYLRSDAPRETGCLIPPSEGAVIFGRRCLEKAQPPSKDTDTARSSSERRSRFRFKIFGKGTLSINDRLARITSGSTTTASSNEATDPLLSEESADES